MENKKYRLIISKIEEFYQINILDNGTYDKSNGNYTPPATLIHQNKFKEFEDAEKFGIAYLESKAVSRNNIEIIKNSY